MTSPAPVLAPGRAVIRLSGDDPKAFLNRLVTNEMESSEPAFAALLTPQGKILCDMIVRGDGAGGLFLDVPAAAAGDLAKRLTMYRLRASIDIADETDRLGVALDADAPPDPRHPGLPGRRIAPREGLGEASFYEAARIALGVPELGRDHAPAELFPADAAMDWLNGVNLKKGCFVGQEVVSRMHRRGNIRKRMVPVRVEGGAPDYGTPMTAGDRPVGEIRSASGEDAIALVRLDRLDKADAPLQADGRAVTVKRTGAP